MTTSLTSVVTLMLSIKDVCAQMRKLAAPDTELSVASYSETKLSINQYRACSNARTCCARQSYPLALTGRQSYPLTKDVRAQMYKIYSGWFITSTSNFVQTVVAHGCQIR